MIENRELTEDWLEDMSEKTIGEKSEDAARRLPLLSAHTDGFEECKMSVISLLKRHTFGEPIVVQTLLLLRQAVETLKPEEHE